MYLLSQAASYAAVKKVGVLKATVKKVDVLKAFSFTANIPMVREAENSEHLRPDSSTLRGITRHSSHSDTQKLHSKPTQLYNMIYWQLCF